MKKFLKCILILTLVFSIYVIFVHEPAHYISCTLIGGIASFKILGTNPATNCIFNNTSNYLKFFYLSAPYFVDMFILLLFIKLKRNRYTYFLPTIAFVNTIGNEIINIFKIEAANDFIGMFSMDISYFYYGITLASLNILLWFTFYRKDLTDKKRLQEILKKS